jgi:hypothetical protein
MSASSSPARPLPSLLSLTVRRGLLAGRFYLAIGIAISVILAVVLLHAAKGATEFVTVFPLEVPLFASLGALGGLMLFVGDRSKGVLEYLISYGVRPSTLFLNCLVVTLVLSSIVMVVALAVGLAGYLALGNPLTTDLENSILGYTVPMTFATSLFAAVCGMVWSALSTPRMGVNSPVGIAPMLGVAPPVLILILAESVAKSEYYDLTVGAAVGFVAVVLVLLAVSTRLMSRERYLSPM